MSDLPGVDLDDLYARLGEMSATAAALRDSLADETEARQNQVRLLERKQLTAQNAIEESGAANRTSGRASRIAVVASLIAVAAVVLGVIAFGVQQGNLRREIDRREADATKAAVVTCVNGNVTRQAIVDEFSAFIDVLLSVSQQPATPEEAAIRRQRVDKLRTDFAAATPAALLARDCSERAVTAPTTLTPTSTTPGS